MKWVDEEFRHSFFEPRRSDAAFACSASDSNSYSDSYGLDLHLEDHRLARLVVLLQRLDRSVGGLSVVPTRELSEILASAIQLSGFMDPVEVRVLSVFILKEVEMRDLVLEARWIPPAPVLGD
ncbi:MAG TPA: hypothetical protein VH350_07065 [Candidatus Sulfotelmatobacter sp.]|jgi:hypothetical protein|nr:hypothetical protein [Candidatus Sulfotelmatobacter sp.]